MENFLMRRIESGSHLNISSKGGGKIIIATWGTLGDLYPFFAIAKALKARGYVPIIATLLEYKNIVNAAGFEFCEMGPSLACLESQLQLTRAEIWRRFADPLFGPIFILKKLLMPNIHRSFEDLYKASSDAVLIITHSIAYGAMIAAQKRGLPQILAAPTPLAVALISDDECPELWILKLLDKLSPSLRRRLGRVVKKIVLRIFIMTLSPVFRLRKEIGLPPSSDVNEVLFSKYATMCLWSNVFASIRPDFPPNSRLMGFQFYDDHSIHKHIPNELKDFLDTGPKPLVFTLGSAGAFEISDFYQKSADIARRLCMRAVLLTGDDRQTERLSFDSNDIFVSSFASHAYLFPRAAAVVHHGGIGTLSDALRVGCRQLIVPISNDQPDNAARAVKKRLAYRLSRRSYDVKTVAGMIKKLLADTQLEENLLQASLIINAEPSGDRVSDFIDSILRVRQLPMVSGEIANSVSSEVEMAQ